MDSGWSSAYAKDVGRAFLLAIFATAIITMTATFAFTCWLIPDQKDADREKERQAVIESLTPEQRQILDL